MRETSAPDLVGVVVGDRQPADVFLHFAAQLGDQALALLGKQLGQGERGDALNDGGGENRAHQRVQHGDLVLVDHVVHQEFWRAGQDQAAQSADHHQQETEQQFAAPRAHQFLQQRQRAAQMACRLLLWYAGRQDYALSIEYTTYIDCGAGWHPNAT